MQTLKSLPLLDVIASKTPAAKNLLQPGAGETANRFNKLLEAVQSGAVENPQVSELDTPGSKAGFEALRLLAGTAETAGDVAQTDGAILTDGTEIEATAPSTVATLAATLGNPSTTLTTSDAMTKVDPNTPTAGSSDTAVLAKAGETTVAAGLIPKSKDPQVSIVGAAQITPDKAVTAAATQPVTAPGTQQSATAPNLTLQSEPSAPQRKSAVANPPVPANTQTAAVVHLAKPNSTSGTLDQSTPVQTQTAAPNIATNAQSNDATTLAIAQKQQSAGLTPQTQIAAPQQTASLAAAAPIVAAPTDGPKPQTTATRGTTALQQELTGSGRAVEPTDTFRPAVPSELQKSALPGALTATVDPKADATNGTKSVWQITNDAQPNFLSKPDTSALAAAPETRAANDIPEGLSRIPTDVLQPTTTPGKDLSSATSAQVATNKTPVSKPFSEALMMQVKAAEVVDGKTSVHLHPRGLGNIDVEIIAGEKDLASKVIVRVENPLILQHLRDDRHLLAQAIGVTDGSIFEFHERGAGQQGGQSQNGQSEFTDTSGESADVVAVPRHADVLADDRIDILT